MVRSAVFVSLIALSGCATSLSAPVVPPPVAGATDGFPAPVAVPPPPAAEAAPVAAHDDDTSASDEDLDEEQETTTEATAGGRPPRAKPAKDPILALGTPELEGRYRHDPTSVGSVTVGRPSAGALVNGVQMPTSAEWELLDPGRAYGTRETVDALVHCIHRVRERFPESPPVAIGHLSAKGGGHLSPHKSHQSGRDADVGYYYQPGTPRVFARATAQNLDMPRTWALVRAALDETDVEMILIDSSIQRWLSDYALMNGVDPAYVDEVFQVRGKNAAAPIRHIKGHTTHIHFRFHNPTAEELGVRLAHVLPRAPEPRLSPPANRVAGKVVTSSSYVEAAGSYAPIRARNGDTLVTLARRYGTTVEELQRVNGLRSNAIRAGSVYKVPQKVAPKPPAAAAPAKHGAAAPPSHKQPVAPPQPPKAVPNHKPPAKPAAPE